MRIPALAALSAALLAGCNTSGTPPSAPAPASTTVTPSNFSLPTGSGCAGDIARYRAVVDNDLSMGHVAQSVYNQITKEIAAASEACSGGKDAQARAMIAASQERHGYHT
ncbi:MAG TPA: hypothetical protein VEC58_00615 [Roseiarcus sp.]|jgi:hypothetical protein|nr:hypothetical protein [Roseiarcus sp.]